MNPPPLPILSADTRLSIRDDVHARTFDDETVLLDLAGGRYFSLNEVGTVLFEALRRGDSLGAAVAEVVGAFEVSQEVAQGDAEALARSLLSEGLAEVQQRGQ